MSKGKRIAFVFLAWLVTLFMLNIAFAAAYNNPPKGLIALIAFIIAAVVYNIIGKEDKSKISNTSHNHNYSSNITSRNICETQKIVVPSNSSYMSQDKTEQNNIKPAESKGVKESMLSDEDLFEKAFKELGSNNRKTGLWAKVFAEAQGNESLAKANYLKIRVGQLANEIEIEKMAALDAERKKMEAQLKETGRDGRFIAYANGTVKDTQTNLMWAAKDNDSYIDYQNAKSYCENYLGGGYSDWRIPTVDELAGLYMIGSIPKKVNITNLINLSGAWFWGLESRGIEAAFFNFSTGNKNWSKQSNKWSIRVLPVRSI